METHEQLDLLRGFDCDQVQGYLISKPLPLAELVEYLTFDSSQQAPLEIVV
ncbi:phage resistance protein [compost metagenome]